MASRNSAFRCHDRPMAGPMSGYSGVERVSMTIRQLVTVTDTTSQPPLLLGAQATCLRPERQRSDLRLKLTAGAEWRGLEEQFYLGWQPERLEEHPRGHAQPQYSSTFDRLQAKTGNERVACQKLRPSSIDPRLYPELLDEARRSRQHAGVAALIDIAMQVSLAVSEASTAVVPVVPGSLACSLGPNPPSRNPGVPPAYSAETVARRGPFGILAIVKSDHMIRNSLYLILSSGLQAALGFTFWIIVARLFSATDVGRASSLISATTLIALLALLGLNNSFVRFLPTAPDGDALITGGLVLVAACGAGLGLVYALATPVIAPRLAFVEQRPVLAVGFVLLSAAAAVNVLTDSVFIAARRSGYNALIDGGIGGIAKLVSIVLLAASGAYGIFCSYADGFLTAALVSMALMAAALHWRPSFRNSVWALRSILRFSGANYVANVLNVLPTLLVPLIVLDRLGTATAAYYYIAFQVASLLYSASYAVSEASLAEGSHQEAGRREVLRRSRRISIALCLPSCLVLFGAAHWVMRAFGITYSQHGTTALALLALAAVPITANNWLLTMLRLQGRLASIVLSSAVYAIAICTLAWFLAPYGLSRLTAAWPIGALLGVAVAAVPRKTQARHRRTKSASRSRHGPAHRMATQLTAHSQF
jgi:O-antigen/teichoic acid export membrane protein